jgi:hypothetical protein
MELKSGLKGKVVQDLSDRDREWNAGCNEKVF